MSGEAAQIVAGAIEVLDELGWIQGLMRTEDGVCLLGALQESQDRLVAALACADWSAPGGTAVAALVMVCNDQYKLGLISEVNDRLLKSKDEAIALLEKTLVNLQERGQ